MVGYSPKRSISGHVQTKGLKLDIVDEALEIVHNEQERQNSWNGKLAAIMKNARLLHEIPQFTTKQEQRTILAGIAENVDNLRKMVENEQSNYYAE
jgi:hypothetical protein